MDRSDFDIVEDYLKTVDTVSSRELQIRFEKGYLWAHRMIDHFKATGYLVLNDVYGNYSVIND